MRRPDIVPMVDLRHPGMPDCIGGFRNPDFPQRFAASVRAFASLQRLVEAW